MVFDHFHVSKLLHEAVDQVRKAGHRQRLAAGDDVLTGTRYFWLQAPENTRAQRFDESIDIFTRSLVTARAGEVKEALAAFYEPDAATAREFLRIWPVCGVRFFMMPAPAILAGRRKDEV